MTEQEIIRASFQFIDEHPDACWNEIPEDLLKCWHVVIPLDKYMSGQFKEYYEYRIFQHALENYCKIEQISVSFEKEMALFCTFQMMLMLPYIERYSDEKRPLFRIFDFGFLINAKRP